MVSGRHFKRFGWLGSHAAVCPELHLNTIAAAEEAADL